MTELKKEKCKQVESGEVVNGANNLARVVASISKNVKAFVFVIIFSCGVSFSSADLKASAMSLKKNSIKNNLLDARLKQKKIFEKWLNGNETEQIYRERLLRRRILWGLVSIVETIAVPREAVSSGDFIESLSGFQVWAIKRLLNELFDEHLDVTTGLDKKMMIALEGAVGWGISIPSKNDNYAYDRDYFVMSINRFLYKVRFFLEHKSISSKSDEKSNEKSELPIFTQYEFKILESLDIPFAIAQAYARRFDILGISDMYYVGVLPEIANDYPIYLDGTSVAFLYFDGVSSYVAQQSYFRFNNYDISILKNHNISIFDAMFFDLRFEVVDIVYLLEHGVSFKVANSCDVSLNAFEIVDIYGE